MLVGTLLWAMYLSIVNMQAAFTFSYGWEWLTCEAGFLAIFLCCPPLSALAPFDGAKREAIKKAHFGPPTLVIWLFRWLAFRLLLGAGMSKVGRNSGGSGVALADSWGRPLCRTRVEASLRISALQRMEPRVLDAFPSPRDLGAAKLTRDS